MFHRDDLAESLHLIVKGRFAVRITTQLGETALLDVLGAGEAFGELALLSPGSRRSATVESLDEGETLSVLPRRLRSPPGRAPGREGRAAAIRSPSSSRVPATASSRPTTPMPRPASAAGLRDLAVRQGQPAVSMTQEHLAEMAGTSRATVNRVLREEERRGTVALSRGPHDRARPRAALYPLSYGRVVIESSARAVASPSSSSASSGTSRRT